MSEKIEWGAAVEPEFTGANAVAGKEIRRVTTAFMFFSKEMNPKVRAELQAQGLPTDLGAIQKKISSIWHTLEPEKRAEYEQKEMEDRQRYEEECVERDREVEEEQARKRKERESMVVDSRMRDRPAYEAPQASKARAKKELTEEEKELKRQLQEEKAARQAHVNQQHAALAKERAEQAEARLSYLLKQSDIFTHFGLKPQDAKDAKKNGGTSSKDAGSGSGGRRAKHRMSEEEGNDDMMEEREAHFLLQQPSVIKHGQLRPYQLEGLNWMIRLQDNGINGILADEMGLGKTLQSISVLGYNYEYNNITGPHLVLVPKSTLSNWCNEFKRWCPVLRVIRFHGTKDERLAIVSERMDPGVDRDWDVVVTTYEVANLERNHLAKFAWQYLIIDEAHRLKNESSQFSTTVRMLQTAHRLLITGTPLQNNLHELWALLNFLLPDVFASADQFDEWFNLQIDDAEQKQRLITQLHKILRPFMLRRLKADVEKSLPKKTETLVFCEMSPLQRETYKKVLERDLSVLAGNENAGRTAILNIVMQLRKACNHPYLFTGLEDRTLDPLGDHVISNCGKMILVDKLLKKLKERGNRVLLFCQMTRMLDILEDFMIMRGHNYCRIDGNTSYEERENLIDAYNAPNSEKFAFLLSTRAGGLGINLQTADTVILYDSDWNPQADLQAQDRAHRIGQKKPVNIYRLVTQGTIEEKIVERAQKKLKLDAMVVQQGRLQNKDKMSKDELLEALRFGADVIFRSKDSNITDEDIDLILERGRKRTEEIEEKLKAADKGDLLDFKLDGGIATQVFEGHDYSKNRGGGDKGSNLQQYLPYMFDMGKRERKQTQNYTGSGLSEEKRMPMTEQRKKSKMPKHLRLPRIDDNWMFYNRERLHEIQRMEEKAYSDMKAQGTLPPDIKDEDLLTEELAEEKKQLLSEGFGEWTKNHYNSFVKASAKYGRAQYDKIAQEIGKSEEAVRAYSAVFWVKGEKEFSAGDWDKIVKNVEKGEKKLEDIARLTKATQELIARFKNPWEELTFQSGGPQGREKQYSTEEDRYLLCLTNYYGYGNWDKVKMAIRRCDRFRFDYFLRSCSSEQLAKRCEQLMRSAEKENAEYEKKRQASEETRKRERDDRVMDEAKREKDEQERKRRLAEVDSRLQEETTRHAELSDATKAVEARYALLKQSQGEGIKLEALVKAEKDSKPAPSGGVGKAGIEAKGFKGVTPKVVPEEFLPELCFLIDSAGPAGIQSIILDFQKLHDSISKRQIEIKINEVAAKKRKDENDPSAKQVWVIKPPFEHLLQEYKGGEAARLVKKRQAEGGTASTKKKATHAKAGGGEGASSGGGGPEKKRKRADDEGSAPGGIKKAKNAITLYMQDNRQRARDVAGSDAEAIKEQIRVWWRELTTEEKRPYQERAKADEERYQRELKKQSEENAAAAGGGE